jgi:hypothetical protein
MAVGTLQRGFRPRFSTLVYVALILLGSLVSVLARREVPVALSASPFDGGLFVREATYLVHGRWLGPFDNLTLAKGPSYPAFIAVTHNLGLPLKIGEQLTWLLAAGCTTVCVWIVTRRRSLAVAAYLVLALNPDSFGALNSGDLRDGWYASLSLLFLSSLFIAGYAAVSRVRIVWVILAGVLAGLSGAAFWLCREEGPWILPAVAVIAVGVPLGALVTVRFGSSRPRPSRRQVLRKLGRYGITAAAVAALFAAPVAFVKIKNNDHYGTTLVNDQTTGAFARAYADWGRVHAGAPERQIPITRAQREAVYRVSPAARELEPTLEDPKLDWRQLSCRYAQSKSRGCDILGAFTVWAIREAANDVGQYRSEPRAQHFFTELSRQITAACDQGRLTCSNRLPTFLQPLQQVQARAAIRTFANTAWDSVSSPAYTAPVSSAAKIPEVNRDAARVVIEPVAATQAAAAAQVRLFKTRGWPYRRLADVYRFLLPVLMLLGLVGTAVGFARPRWPRAALSILCTAFAVGSVTRLALLTVVVLTQFDAGGGRYQLPSRALMLAFGVVGTAILVEQLWAWRRSHLQRSTGAESSDHGISLQGSAEPPGPEVVTAAG